jgi:hypothetical protein
MFNTDLKGFLNNLKQNQIAQLLLLVGVCIFLYSLLSKFTSSKNDFNNIIHLQGMLNNMQDTNNTNNMNITNTCKKDIPRIDEALFRNTINLPNRNPAMLTSSMVYPVPTGPSDEDKRKTRMDVLNMFYNSFDDDLTTIKSRPQNLYVIP